MKRINYKNLKDYFEEEIETGGYLLFKKDYVAFEHNHNRDLSNTNVFCNFDVFSCKLEENENEIKILSLNKLNDKPILYGKMYSKSKELPGVTQLKLEPKMVGDFYLNNNETLLCKINLYKETFGEISNSPLVIVICTKET